MAFAVFHQEKSKLVAEYRNNLNMSQVKNLKHVEGTFELQNCTRDLDKTRINVMRMKALLTFNPVCDAPISHTKKCRLFNVRLSFVIFACALGVASLRNNYAKRNRR